MNFWERVDNLIDEKGYTKKKLALAANFDQSNITKGIKNNNVPSAETAVQIAHFLGVTVEYLVTGQDSSFSCQNKNIIEDSKYSSLINDLEKLSTNKQKFLINMIKELKNL